MEPIEKLARENLRQRERRRVRYVIAWQLVTAFFGAIFCLADRSLLLSPRVSDFVERCLGFRPVGIPIMLSLVLSLYGAPFIILGVFIFARALTHWEMVAAVVLEILALLAILVSLNALSM